MDKIKKYSEEELIKGCQNNERVWQERLYRTYFKAMFQMVLFYTQDEDRAMEYLNLGFLRCFKKIYLCEHTGSLEGWLRKTIWNVLMSQLKKENSQQKFEEISTQVKSIESHDQNPFYETDILDLVKILPPATARVFLLYAQDGLTHKEIGQQLHISEGTSKWHMSSARDQMKKLIEKYDV